MYLTYPLVFAAAKKMVLPISNDAFGLAFALLG